VLFVFASASKAVKAEAALRKAGVPCALVPLPRTLGSQCGVCLRVAAGDRQRAEEVLSQSAMPVMATYDTDDAGAKTVGEEGRRRVGDDTPGGARVVTISSDSMGRGDEELGRVLLRNYLHTLTELEPRPDVLVFFNNGVRLAVLESPAVEDLRTLSHLGVKLLLCGTCVNTFGIKEDIGVGEISNMYAISETMLRAASVINL